MTTTGPHGGDLPDSGRPRRLRQALPQAFGTPEGRACAADRRVLAPDDDDLQMYLYEAVEV